MIRASRITLPAAPIGAAAGAISAIRSPPAGAALLNEHGIECLPCRARRQSRLQLADCAFPAVVSRDSAYPSWWRQVCRRHTNRLAKQRYSCVYGNDDLIGRSGNSISV